MSDEVAIELGEIIQKGKEFDKKWNVYKILTVIICMFSSTYYIGTQVGDWRQWRDNTTMEVKEIKEWKQGLQASLNNQRAEYNRNIKIK